MTRLQKLLPWLIGILVASLLMGALMLFADPQFTGNDDAPILRATMGYEGGEPATFNLHMHAAFVWLLYGLAKLAPGVAWFSILQLFLLWFSQVVIVKSLCLSARRSGLSLWTGAATGALFLGAFALYISCRVTYTVTAALCGAAAVAWLSGADFSAGRKQVFYGIFGSTAMLLCCYFLRMSAALPAACFWLTVFGVKWFSARSRPALAALLAVAALFALSIGAQAWNTGAQGARADVQWHDRRIELFDFAGFPADVPDETLTEIGWSRDELALVQNWFFLNDNVTAEAFQTLIDQQAQAEGARTVGGRIAAAWRTAAGAFADAKLRLALWCALLTALAAALRGKQRTWLLLALALLGGFALMMILGAMGRLNARAAYSVLLPAAAVVYAAVFDGKSEPKKRWVSLAVCAPLLMCLALTAFAGVRQMDDTYIAPSPYFTDTTTDLHADLDEIALMNEDKLIVCDLSLSHDHRLFPDTSGGVPRNVMLWGGWQSHTPGWRRMLEGFGITALDPSLFLRDNVLFASTYDQPTEEMMNYVSEAADGIVDWTYYEQWGYVNLFAFEIYQARIVCRLPFRAASAPFFVPAFSGTKPSPAAWWPSRCRSSCRR